MNQAGTQRPTSSQLMPTRSSNKGPVRVFQTIAGSFYHDAASGSCLAVAPDPRISRIFADTPSEGWAALRNDLNASTRPPSDITFNPKLCSALSFISDQDRPPSTCLDNSLDEVLDLTVLCPAFYALNDDTSRVAHSDSTTGHHRAVVVDGTALVSNKTLCLHLFIKGALDRYGCTLCCAYLRTMSKNRGPFAVWLDLLPKRQPPSPGISTPCSQ